MQETVEQWMRRTYKPGRFRNEPGFHADREQRLIAAANATGCADPNRDRVAILAVDGFKTRDADERLLRLGDGDGRFLSFLSEKHRTLLS
jgi:hypothetical protein